MTEISELQVEKHDIFYRGNLPGHCLLALLAENPFLKYQYVGEVAPIGTDRGAPLRINATIEMLLSIVAKVLENNSVWSATADGTHMTKVETVAWLRSLPVNQPKAVTVN